MKRPERVGVGGERLCTDRARCVLASVEGLAAVSVRVDRAVHRVDWVQMRRRGNVIGYQSGSWAMGLDRGSKGYCDIVGAEEREKSLGLGVEVN